MDILNMAAIQPAVTAAASIAAEQAQICWLVETDYSLHA
jgi:hypothetical protein